MLKYYKAEIYEHYISVCKDSVSFREIQEEAIFSTKNNNPHDPVKRLKTLIKGSRCMLVLVTFGRGYTSQSSKTFPEMAGCLGRSSKKLCEKNDF